MRPVWIIQAELQSALGDRPATWRRLLAGETGVAGVTRFAVEPYATQVAACLPGLALAECGSRLDSLFLPLLANLPELPEETELLLASIKGRIDLMRPGLEGDAEALALVEPQRLLEDLLRRLRLQRGENVHAACASSTIALGQAASRIATGQADAVLVLAADLVSEFAFSGFAALKGLSTSQCRPFDRRRDGLVLGEGAAALLLTSPEQGRAAGFKPLAELVGWGTAGDAHHITAPARDAAGLIAAVRQALRQAEVSAAAVTAISAHGTGTVYNDLMELTAFATLFPGMSLPLNSVKGAIGHCLGAAGAMEVVLGIEALQRGQLPPTWGCEEPEETALRVGSESQEFGDGLLLSTNSGFGGINSALLLRRGGEE